MKKVKNKKFDLKLKKHGFQEDDFNSTCSILSYHYIYEAGFSKNPSLKNKKEFYQMAYHFSEILKSMVLQLEDKIYIGGYGHTTIKKWSNWKDFDVNHQLLEHIKKNQAYCLEVPKDLAILDILVEGGLRYLMRFDIYFPKNKMNVVVNEHSSLDLYIRGEKEKILYVLDDILKADHTEFCVVWPE